MGSRPVSFADGTTVQHYSDASVTLKRVTGVSAKLVCSCTRYAIKSYCNHVETTILNRRDLDTIEVDTYLLVPIFKKPILNVTMIARLPDPGSDYCPLVVVLRRNPYRDLAIGYYMPGEARRDMRRMFIEWIMGHMEQAYHMNPPVNLLSDGLCASPHHVGNRNMLERWTEIDEQMIPIYACHYWHLATSGHCYACHQTTSMEL